MTPLEPEDGLDHCVACLGVDHLQEALTDEACMNCSIMPRSVRLARLAQLGPPACLPSFQSERADFCGAPAQKRTATRSGNGAPAKRRKTAAKVRLSSEVDRLAADMEHMKALLMNLQPAGGGGTSCCCAGPGVTAATERCTFHRSFVESVSGLTG